MTTTQTTDIKETLRNLIKEGKVKGSFAESLAKQQKPLSPRQEECALDIIGKVEARLAPKTTEVKKDATKIDLSGILQLIEKGKAAGLKNPSFRLQLKSGKPIKLNIYKDGRIFINTNEFGNGLGHIEPNGLLVIKHSTSEQDKNECESLLKDFAADPAKVGGEFGKMTSHCCFCKLELTTDESKGVGYGPKCAKKFDLPWGKTAINQLRISIQ